MHFIPNPSNTEFIYLLGLEQCVEYILHHTLTDPKPIPFICSQCGTDFTPAWKWNKNSGLKPSSTPTHINSSSSSTSSSGSSNHNNNEDNTAAEKKVEEVADVKEKGLYFYFFF